MAKKNYVEKKFSCVREGLTIRGLLFEPVNGRENAEGKWPVAIVSHMFMVNYKLVEKYARFLAEQGYLAVCYDFNGGGLFSKSDGKSVDMSVLTEVKDLEAVIEAVLKHEKADASRLMLMAKFDPQNIPEKIKCGFMKLGRCYVTDVIEMDAFREIAAYEGPVLILHGTADNAVDCANSKKAAEIYKNVRLELIEGAGHGFLKENGVRAMELLKSFVN